MRRAQPITLLGLAIPLLTLPAQLESCLPAGGAGGTTPLFNLPPTIVMTADVQRGVAPLTVSFSSSGSSDNGFIVERLWEFGDGSTSPDISPTHIFQSTGTYTVRLTLTDDQGAQASKTLIISVTERPIARFTVFFGGTPNVTSAENAPATFRFDGSASYDPDAKEGEKLLYRWDFGDGSRELLAVVDHTFATPGTYRVRLTVTDAVGVTGFTDQMIEVGIPRPAISFLSPPAGIANLVLTPASALWTHVVVDVEPGVPYRLRAGLDGDRDSCGGVTVLYDPNSGSEQRRYAAGEERLRAAVFSADGRLLLTGGEDGVVRRYDARSSSGFATSYTHTGSAVLALAFAPDGGSFAAGYRDGSIVIREIDTSGKVTKTRTLPTQATAVNAVAFSPDGSQLVTGNNSGTATLWRVADGGVIFHFDHAGAPVTSVTFVPADPQRVLTASADQYARAWSTVNGRLAQEFGPVYNEGRLVAGHAGAVNAVAASPDGTLVATASADKTAKVWELTSGREVRTLSAHSGPVNAVAFSPDGTQLITGGDEGSAIIWRTSTGEQVRVLKPCSSPVAAVAYAADGQSLLTAVGAYNDIQLDTYPPQGNDLNLTLPTALKLPSNLPVGEEGRVYYLWAEVNTDRSAPARSYAGPAVRVVNPFVSTISDPNLPTIPYARVIRDAATNTVEEVASVVVPATTKRQIFSLGPLSLGDRLYISLLSLPGYGETYTQGGVNPLSPPPVMGIENQRGFSVLILDDVQRMYAWYEAQRALFSRDSKLIIGHDSTNYYVVLDAVGGELVPSINVRIRREFADSSEPRQQYVHLNFEGGSNIAVAGTAPFNLSPFTIAGRSSAAVATVRAAIVARVQDQLKSFGFVVSETAPESTTQPHLTIYFDVDGGLLVSNFRDRNQDGTVDYRDLYMWGMPNFIDPRDETLSGRAVVAVSEILAVPAYAALADAQLGLTIGNSALHQIGLLCGLRQTTQEFPDDLMTNDPNQVSNAALVFATDAPLAFSDDRDPVGLQDAPMLLGELFGQ